MNQISNVAKIGFNATNQAVPRKPVASHASRNGIEGDAFRIPRGASASQTPAPARNDRALQETRAIRGGHGEHRNSGDAGGKGPRESRKPTPRKGDRSGKRKALVALLIIALLLAGFGVWKFMNLSPEEATGGAFYDQSASEIQEAVDHEVQDGYFNMSINTSVPVFEDNSAAIGIRNIESNQYDCIVTVTLDDGTEVYRSGGLAPGSELDMVTLTQDLEPGDYEATAVFEIYEQDEAHTVAGQTASKLTLHVL